MRLVFLYNKRVSIKIYARKMYCYSCSRGSVYTHIRFSIHFAHISFKLPPVLVRPSASRTHVTKIRRQKPRASVCACVHFPRIQAHAHTHTHGKSALIYITHKFAPKLLHSWRSRARRTLLFGPQNSIYHRVLLYINI